MSTAQRLLADAVRGRVILEREVRSVATHRDPHPSLVAPVRFLIEDIEKWLAANLEVAGDTEEAEQLVTALGELHRLLTAIERAPSVDDDDDQPEDTLDIPVGLLDHIDELRDHGKAIDTAEVSTTVVLLTIVNGFADEWADALERAKRGDYRGLSGITIDTLALDDAETGGVVAVERAAVLTAKLTSIANSARAVSLSAYATASMVPIEASDIAAAMADGAEAFLARLRTSGMQMSTAAGRSSAPDFDGLSSETLADAAEAAKQAFKERRLTQQVAKHSDAAVRSDAPAPATDERRRSAPAVSCGSS